jgi:hypothetical protein
VVQERGAVDPFEGAGQRRAQQAELQGRAATGVDRRREPRELGRHRVPVVERRLQAGGDLARGRGALPIRRHHQQRAVAAAIAQAGEPHRPGLMKPV